MKRLLVIILMLLIAVQSFSKWLILLDYTLHQEYIAAVLCENKAKPELQCKGTCQLKKKLSADEKENTGKDGAQAKLKFAEVLFQNSVAALHLQDIIPVAPNPLIPITTALYHTPQGAVFHPPLGA